MDAQQVRLAVCDGRSETSAPALLVGIASSDLKSVNQHFGSAVALATYRVTADSVALSCVTRFDAANHDGNESKLPAKIEALKGCAAVFCEAAGGSAVKQLLAAGIQPVKLEAGTPVNEVLAWMQGEIRKPTLAWVSKALQASGPRDESRFNAMASEGWDG